MTKQQQQALAVLTGVGVVAYLGVLWQSPAAVVVGGLFGLGVYAVIRGVVRARAESSPETREPSP